MALTALNLRAGQAQDLRQSRLEENLPRRDSSSLEVTQKSPLELPQKSYALESEETNGTPSLIAELQAQRGREAKMREASEQFSGAPSLPTARPRGEAPASETGGEQAPPPEAETLPGGEGSANVEEQQTGYAEALQAQQAQQSSLLQRMRQAVGASAIQQNQTQKEKKQQDFGRIWRTTKMIFGFLSFVGIGYPGYWAMSNWELANEITVKDRDLAPKPNLADIGITNASNVGFCTCILPQIIFWIVVIMLAAAILDKLSGILSFFS